MTIEEHIQERSDLCGDLSILLLRWLILLKPHGNITSLHVNILILHIKILTVLLLTFLKLHSNSSVEGEVPWKWENTKITLLRKPLGKKWMVIIQKLHIKSFLQEEYDGVLKKGYKGTQSSEHGVRWNTQVITKAWQLPHHNREDTPATNASNITNTSTNTNTNTNTNQIQIQIHPRTFHHTHVHSNCTS